MKMEINFKVNVINNVINNDSTNVKLGLLLSENLNLTRVKKVQNGPNSEIDKIIESSVISPRGMVYTDRTHLMLKKDQN